MANRHPLRQQVPPLSACMFLGNEAKPDRRCSGEGHRQTYKETPLKESRRENDVRTQNQLISNDHYYYFTSTGNVYY